MCAKLIVILLFFVLAPMAHAHTRFMLDGSTPPRSENDGLKVGPCGNIARTKLPTTLLAGSTVDISWEETINHSGYFTLAFSITNDEGFDENILATIVDTQGAETPLPHRYTQSVMLPNIECDQCTLQLIQYMTENPENPRLYYSCADIALSAAVEVPVDPEEPLPEPDVITKERIRQDFEQVDADSSDSIDIYELQQAIPHADVQTFNQFDSNADGLLTMVELSADDDAFGEEQGNSGGGNSVAYLMMLFWLLLRKRVRVPAWLSSRRSQIYLFFR